MNWGLSHWATGTCKGETCRKQREFEVGPLTVQGVPFLDIWYLGGLAKYPIKGNLVDSREWQGKFAKNSGRVGSFSKLLGCPRNWGFLYCLEETGLDPVRGYPNPHLSSTPRAMAFICRPGPVAVDPGINSAASKKNSNERD